MMDRIERLTEGEVRDVPRGHRVDRDSPADLDLREDASEAVAGDLPDRVVERRVPKILGLLPPHVYPPPPSSPSPLRGRPPGPIGHNLDLPPGHTPPCRGVNFSGVLARVPRSP